MPTNAIGDKLLQRKAVSQPDFYYLRKQRQFDEQSYERAVNTLTEKLTSDPSQRQAVADALGLKTTGLIIGGRRDIRDERGGNAPKGTTSSTRPRQEYVNPTTGTVIIPGAGTKPPTQTQSGSGSKTPTKKPPPKTGTGGLQGPP